VNATHQRCDYLLPTKPTLLQKHLNIGLTDTDSASSARDSTPTTTQADLAAMISTNSDFVDFILPLQERLALYDRTSPPSNQMKNDATDPAKAVPQGFIDAMSVRESVFVHEQGVPLENELDFDDRRCFTWTAYASVPGHTQPAPDSSHWHPMRKPSTSTKLAIGTIRLIPPPNTINHTFDKHRNMDGSPYSHPIPKSSIHDGRECFITLGRLAILKEFRGVGVAEELNAHLGITLDTNTEWNGLVLIHAQIGLQKFWKRYGFEVDEAMGIWDEEGMDHVAMWKRLDLKKASKATAPYSYTEEPKRFRGSVSG
jgi:predicted GNAT family N-acyltransferase